MTHEEFKHALAERWRWLNWLAMWNLVGTFRSMGL